jgi:hypothetical protein
LSVADGRCIILCSPACNTRSDRHGNAASLALAVNKARHVHKTSRRHTMYLPVPVPSAQHKVSCTWTQCSAVQCSTAQYTAVHCALLLPLCTAPVLPSALGRSRSQPWRSSHSAISLTAHTSQLIGADSSRAGLSFQLVVCPCRVCHDNNSWADAGVIDLSCLRPAQPLVWLLSAFPRWLAPHSHVVSQPHLPAPQLHHHHHHPHHPPPSPHLSLCLHLHLHPIPT